MKGDKERDKIEYGIGRIREWIHGMRRSSKPSDPYSQSRRVSLTNQSRKGPYAMQNEYRHRMNADVEAVNRSSMAFNL